MARYIKIQMTRHPDGHITYTADHQKGKRWRLSDKVDIVAYEDLNDPTKVYCIGVVSDADIAEFLKEPNIMEITKTDAITLGRQWQPQTAKVTDIDKVLKILAKRALGNPLTQVERDALDENSAEIGINKTPDITNRINLAEKKRNLVKVGII